MSLLDMSGCKGGYVHRSPELDRSLGKEGIIRLPWAVAAGWGDVHDLLARPYLEHVWDSIESFMHHFPVHQVKLVAI